MLRACNALSMIDYILLSFILALAINGLHIAFTWDDMLLVTFGLLLESYLPQWTCKMLFLCPTCMSGIYGLLFFTYNLPFDFVWLLTGILVTACLSTIISRLLDIIDLKFNDVAGNFKL